MEYELHKRKPVQTLQSGPVALLAGGIAAFLASACCLGPLVLILLGFSGAWISRLSVLEPYVPSWSGSPCWPCTLPGGASTDPGRTANAGYSSSVLGATP